MQEVFKIGDIVHLKSGSPDLKIIEIVDVDVVVEWFIEGERRVWTFPAVGFQKIK